MLSRKNFLKNFPLCKIIVIWQALKPMKFYENIPQSICPYSPDEDDKGKEKPKAKQVKLAQTQYAEARC